jgi:hypothetical protein
MYDAPPKATIPPAQASGNVAVPKFLTMYQTTLLSEVSSEETETLRRENDLLRKEMQEFKLLITQQNTQSLSQFQFQMITDVATQAAIAAIQQIHSHDHSTPPSTPVHQKKRIDTKDTPEHMSRQDIISTRPQDNSPDIQSLKIPDDSSFDAAMPSSQND